MSASTRDEPAASPSRAAALGVTLQINLAPTDLPHLRDILPHELRQFGGQVDEVLLVLDLDRNPMVSESVWSRGEAGVRELVAGLEQSYPHLRMLDVDGSPETVAEVAAEFFGGRPIPDKDWRGAPIYAYFFGLWAARNNYVLHMDSDMLFGGGSQTWVSEAVELMRSRPDVLICSPLAGPPTADGTLTTQDLPREPHEFLAFRAGQVSTRIFMIDRARFRESVRALEVLRPARQKILLAHVDGFPAHECAETLLSHALASRGLSRIDLLGSGAGMWSLHPPYRSEHFYNRLPWLIEAIETGMVTESQRGAYDVDDSMIDWTGARPTKVDRIRWHVNRIRGRIRLARAPARRTTTA